MSSYQQLPAEIKLQIWQGVFYEHGMHHFKISHDRFRSISNGHPLSTQLVKVSPTPGEKKSAWRVRQKLARIDEYAWDVAKKFFRINETKVMCPLYPMDPRGAGQAIIHLENDIICVRFEGMILPTWVRPPASPGMFAGIKRVALEYRAIGSRYPDNAFRCRCDPFVHRGDYYCPKTIDHFIHYFPDLEKLYFVTKINKTGSILPPVLPSLSLGTKRDHLGNAKSFQRRMGKPRLTRAQAIKKLYADTVENIKSTALREGLAFCQDTKFDYFEAKEDDAETLVVYHHISKLFTELKKRWEEQKKTDNLPHPVREVALGVLVHYDKPKPIAANE
ncbi:hypothetical protein F5Y13DRAFT_190686 [Hypoxylon sp. FL1857]|nr:hypothetical protein F5Y13DRAFT_190686 [Hypoxylon sp. FL1857]